MELCNRGYQINHKIVQQLMKILGLKCMVRMKKYHSYKGYVGKIAPNILQRNFFSAFSNDSIRSNKTDISIDSLWILLAWNPSGRMLIQIIRIANFFNSSTFRSEFFNPFRIIHHITSFCICILYNTYRKY